MPVLFCVHPLDPAAVEPPFDREAAADAGPRLRLDFDLWSEGDDAAALRRVPPAGEDRTVVYRGWMMPPPAYERLDDALRRRGYRPLTTPAAYGRSHHFGGWCEAVGDQAARFVQVDEANASDPTVLATALAPLAGRPAVLKDQVKSVPGADRVEDPADASEVALAVARLVDACDGRPAWPLVFREHIDFRPGPDGRPDEVRTFVLRGRVVCSHRRASPDDGESPPRAWLSELAGRVDSPFFTIDAARDAAGRWRVVEVGDGQVSELPAAADTDAFVAALT